MMNSEHRPVVGEGGRITLPKAVREAANLRQGDELQMRITPEGILLRRAEERDPDQWWFWTEEWQRKEREADEDIRLGRSTLYLSDEEFRQALVDRMKPE